MHPVCVEGEKEQIGNNTMRYVSAARCGITRHQQTGIR